VRANTSGVYPQYQQTTEPPLQPTRTPPFWILAVIIPCAVIVAVCAVLFVVAICGRTCRVERQSVCHNRSDEASSAGHEELLGESSPNAAAELDAPAAYCTAGDDFLGSSRAPVSPARCPVGRQAAESKMTPSTVSDSGILSFCRCLVVHEAYRFIYHYDSVKKIHRDFCIETLTETDDRHCL
jgi:hypothetical protein